jgi:hypothetical protein
VEAWAAGELICLGCGYDEGIHTWLVGSEPVECSECSEMLCVPKDTETVWQLR